MTFDRAIRCQSVCLQAMKVIHSSWAAYAEQVLLPWQLGPFSYVARIGADAT